MDFLAFVGASWWAWLLAGAIALLVAIPLWVKLETSAIGCLTPVVTGIVIFALVFGAFAAISAYTTVQRGTVGLVSRFGALTGVVFQPGLHWKTPFIETIEVFDTTQQSYETSEHVDTSNAQWRDYPVTSQTSDGQTVQVTFTTIFRIPDGDTAVDIRQNVGPLAEIVENVVKANSRSATRNLSKFFTAEQLYTGDILEYQEAVRGELEAKFAEQGYGLVLEDFLIRNTKFEEKYTDAVEAKQIAAENIVKQENDALAAVYEAQKAKELAIGEAQATEERAKGEAEAVRIRADASAYAIEVDADAQAYATEEIGKALERYEKVLQLRFIENLNNQTVWLPSAGIEFLLPAPE